MFNVTLSEKNTYPSLGYHETLSSVLNDNVINNKSNVIVFSEDMNVTFSGLKQALKNSSKFRIYADSRVSQVKTKTNGKNWFIMIKL